MMRGIRGAITVDRNDRPSILQATQRLLQAIAGANDLTSERIASVLVTSTADLDSAFPGQAVRAMWPAVPVIGATELSVPGALQRCIRVLVHADLQVAQGAIHHVYLEGARGLRPDLVAAVPTELTRQTASMVAPQPAASSQSLPAGGSVLEGKTAGTGAQLRGPASQSGQFTVGAAGSSSSIAAVPSASAAGGQPNAVASSSRTMQVMALTPDPAADAAALRLRHRNIAIVGLGQIGGSIAAALAQRHAAREIVGVDLFPDVAQTARRRRIIDRVAGSTREAIATADIAILAAPIDEIVRMMPDVAAAMRADAVLADVGSTKRAIVQAVGKAGLAARYAGLHPFAGTERAGPAGYDPNLFRGKSIAITPTVLSAPDVLEVVRDLCAVLGAEPFDVDVPRHDRAVALTSHLPHAVAYGLAALLARDDQRELNERVLAGSFLDATRVAASDPAMVAAMLSSNAQELKARIDELQQELHRIEELLDHPAQLVRYLRNLANALKPKG